MTTEEGNKVIAEFMGAKWQFQGKPYHKDGWWFDNRPTQHASAWHDTEDLQYHSSWDWLMPVVEKISDMDNVYLVEINLGHTAIHSDKIFENLKEGICGVWLAVIDFILWYTAQKQKKGAGE